MSRDTFLQSVADYFCTAGAGSGRPAVGSLTFVLPNKRSALFLRRHIRDSAGGPTLMPRLMTLASFAALWSPAPAADRTELLFILYQAYRTVMLAKGRPADTRQFDDFIFWGDMMLGDFDEVDKSMADARQVFKNIKDIKEIQADFLDQEQKEVVRRVWGDSRLTANIERFWLHADPGNCPGDAIADAIGADGDETTHMREKFLFLWEILADIYTEYHRLLQACGRSSEGMIQRTAADAVRAAEMRDFTGDTKYVFVGFNDLTAAETLIFDRLRRKGMALFFWDTSALSLFAGTGHTLPPPLQRLQRLAKAFPAPDDYVLPARGPARVHTVSVPSNVAQAKIAGQILAGLADGGLLDPDNAINTAVVLPDESLLLPLLASIPPQIKSLNISMGLPYRSTSFATLLHAIISMQMRSRTLHGTKHFFYQDILEVLSHPHIQTVMPDSARAIVENIQQQRLYNISADELCASYPDLAPVFAPVAKDAAAAAVAAYLTTLLDTLGAALEARQGSSPATAKFETAAIEYFRRQTGVLAEFVERYKVTMTDRTFFTLFERVFSARGLTLSGTPLRGLQILGVLETRSLDFDNVIILSMNESVFPRRRYTRTMIPAALRSGYGLPDFDSPEWSYAYCYYRLLARSQQLHLLYDSRQGGVGQGEASRYLTQTVRLLPELVHRRQQAQLTPVPGGQAEFVIAKTPAVMAALDRFRAGGPLRLSATALKAYMTCPFRFYLQYVRSMRSGDDIVDNISPSEYGNVIHRVIQSLFDTRKGQIINRKTIESWIDSPDTLRLITDTLNREHYHLKDGTPLEQFPSEGRIAAQSLRTIINSNLRAEIDAYCTPDFIYAGSEVEVGSDPKNRTWHAAPGLDINFYMSIDRVDRLDARTLRFIDFKSGADGLSATMNKIFTGDHTASGIFQILLYCAVWRDMVDPDTEIVPMIHSMRHLAASTPLLPLVVEKTPVTAYSAVAGEYESRLTELVEKIFDPETPFAQRPHENQDRGCHMCPFTALCGRHPQIL